MEKVDEKMLIRVSSDFLIALDNIFLSGFSHNFDCACYCMQQP
jgi:hypothetical protein